MMLRAPWFGLFGRQLFRDILVNTTLAMAAGLALFVAVDFVETGNLVRQDASFFDLFLLELYNMPLVVQQVGHLAAVIGTTSAVAALLRRGEVVAILAAGAPPTVLLKPALLVGLLFAAGFACMTEWVLPAARAEVTALRRELGLPVKNTDVLRRHQTWFRGRERIFRVEDLVDPEGRTLAGVLVLDLKEGHLRDRWDIDRLRFEDGRWIGEGIVRRRFEGDALETTRLDRAELSLTESPKDFVQSIGAPDRMRYGALVAAVDARERLGQPVVAHRLELYRRHAHPLSILCAVILAVAMTLALSRRPSMAAALGAGGALGFGLWILDEVGLALGSTSAVSPEPAAHVGMTLVLVGAFAAWARALRRGVAD